MLRACLGLLEADSGPVLEDYLEDIPADTAPVDFTGMSCPIDLPSLPSTDSELTQSLIQEIEQIAPWYDLAVGQRNRTTVGISELDILDAGRFLIDFIEDPSSSSPRPEVEVGPMLKYACEDLKAFYSEAASAQPGMSSSLSVENWLWNETVLGKVLWNFREEHVNHPDSYVGYLAQRGLIPDRQIQFKGPRFSNLPGYASKLRPGTIEGGLAASERRIMVRGFPAGTMSAEAGLIAGDLRLPKWRLNQGERHGQIRRYF